MPDVAYIDDILVVVGSLLSGTVAVPLIGTGITFMLVLAIMYQIIPLFEIRDTAQLYATRRFRVLLTLVAAGFGLGFSLFFNELEQFVQMSDPLSAGLIGGWCVVGAFALSLYLASTTDPTRPGNPVVGLLSRITGMEPSEYRRTEVTHSWAPIWISARMAIIAAAVVLTIITLLLGLVVAFAVRIYPLPEILVLTWVFSQLVGIHRLPHLGWLEDIEVEQQVYEKLGSGTTTFYGIMVAFGYLVVLSIGTATFAIVGVPVLGRGISTLSEQVSSRQPTALFTSDEELVRFVRVLVNAISPLVTGIHWIAYWILALLRLPSVTTAVLSEYSTTPRPAYRRLEGVTLPGSALFVWFALYGRIEVYAMQMWLQVLFIMVFLVLFIMNAWTFYRAIWADLDPQPVHREERVIQLAVSVQALSLVVAILLADVAPTHVIVLMGVLMVGFLVFCQQYTRQMHLVEADEFTPGMNIVVIGVCLVLAGVIHLVVPEFSPTAQFILLGLALMMAVSAIMTHRHS